jgi:hypothetical protein
MFNWKNSTFKLIKGKISSIFKTPVKKWLEENCPKVKKAPRISARLFAEIKKEGKIKENYDIGKISYQELYPSSHPSFFWLKPKELPLKLYNIRTNEVEKVEDIKSKGDNMKSYATLSYAWGISNEITEATKKKFPQWKDNLTLSGNKALVKAVEACLDRGIDYLWMDQLCINQDDNEEKAQEVARMKQYFDNSTVTLISINTNTNLFRKFTNSKETTGSENKMDINLFNLMKMIIRSEWFSRSWTFQEGFLSKQTIFMFDDMLVDGREIAALWVLHQSSYSNEVNFDSPGECSEGLTKIATPLGWVYYKEGYDTRDTVSLGLDEALRVIKKRKRTFPIDGIYSILGLLPYGNKIKVEYKERKYSSEELREKLFEVMQEAVKAGYGEPLGWHGSGNGWLPEINDNGSTSIVGGLRVKCKPRGIIFKDKKIEVNGSRYVIKHSAEDIIWIGGRSKIDGGISMGYVGIGIGDEFKKLKLWGRDKTIKEIKEGDSLLVFDEDKIKSNEPFAMLATREGEVYRRKGLIKLTHASKKKLNKSSKHQRNQRKLVIELGDNTWENQENIKQTAQIIQKDLPNFKK